MKAARISVITHLRPKKILIKTMLWNRFIFDSDSSGENQAFSSATIIYPNSELPGAKAQSIIRFQTKVLILLKNSRKV